MPEIPFACKWTLTETELNRARNFDNVRLRTATNDVSVNNDPRFGYFFRLRTDNNEEARVCLCLDLRDVTEVKANFTFAITSANLSETINNHTFRNEHGHGIHLCTTDEFFRQGSNFIVDGKFTLSVNGIFKFNITGEPAAIEQINTCKPLSQRLWTATNQDFTIVVEEGNESTDYPIHQHVVGAHSTVFAEMFKLKNNEAVKDKITINDYSAKVFETALQMIYETEFTFNLTFEEWMSLLKFFHRYQYQCYKDKVEEYCIQQIQASTVCRLTNLSILTNSPKLKEACLTFLDSAIVSKTYLSDYETLDLTLIAQIVLNSAVHTCETLNNA